MPAHNEIISVLLRHAQRHSDKFLCWMLSLELHEKILGSQNYAFFFFFEKRNEHLSTDTATKHKLKIYL